jgi:signal peptidase I
VNEHLPTQYNTNHIWEGCANAPLRMVEETPVERPVPPAPKRSVLRTNVFSLPWTRQIFVWVCIIFFSVVSYSICNQFVVTSVVVQGKSMMPTLREGDRCLLDRWTYRHSDPKRGDMVVLHDPGHDDCAVKRIVGLPGESIQFNEGKVFVNHAPLPEPYLGKNTVTVSPDGLDKVIVLGKDQYFVLGDNRMVSEDSRFYGPIKRDKILGNLAMK